MSGWLPGPLVELLEYVANYVKQDTPGFLSILFIILTPLLVISAYLSYQLVKREEKKMKKREQKDKMVARAKKKLHKTS